MRRYRPTVGRWSEGCLESRFRSTSAIISWWTGSRARPSRRISAGFRRSGLTRAWGFGTSRPQPGICPGCCDPWYARPAPLWMDCVGDSVGAARRPFLSFRSGVLPPYPCSLRIAQTGRWCRTPGELGATFTPNTSTARTAQSCSAPIWCAPSCWKARAYPSRWLYSPATGGGLKTGIGSSGFWRPSRRSFRLPLASA